MNHLVSKRGDWMHSETIAVHSGYEIEPSTKAGAVPIYQTVAYAFDTAKHGAALFSLEVEGHRYGRISNPPLLCSNGVLCPRRRCCPECGWNLRWRSLRPHKDIGSSSEVNCLVSEFLTERLPSVDLAHGDLARSKQCPEQHRRGLGGRQYRLGLDAALELLMEAFDRVGGTRALPLARR